MSKTAIKYFQRSKLVSVKPQESSKGISLEFTIPPSDEAGIYVVHYCGRNGKKSPAPFYVGEARNLLRRLTMLFRCNSHSNPHPCQMSFAIISRKKISEIECKDFCKCCKVKFVSTHGLLGRIEIEEALQNRYGTNCDVFYKRFLDEE
ncbi:MAG TPA: hypothetical protein VHY30_03455 [Verrucomicrobiae bacterium]|jgi:hypothetical protein|nr:hypothetical protein [Verrucomicrobiae bacterium]